jgi:hypothetical protein
MISYYEKTRRATGNIRGYARRGTDMSMTSDHARRGKDIEGGFVWKQTNHGT